MELETKIRIMLADENALFRASLTKLLNEFDNMYVVSEVSTGKELVYNAVRKRPDIILADINLRDFNLFKVMSDLKENECDCNVLILAGDDQDEIIYFTIKIGAKGVVTKTSVMGELIFAIEKVSQGKHFFNDPTIFQRLDAIKERYDKIVETKNKICNIELNHREEQIIKLISQGFRSHEIAKHLGISKRTVDVYRSNLMQRFEFTTVTELIIFAVKFSIYREKEFVF